MLGHDDGDDDDSSSVGGGSDGGMDLFADPPGYYPATPPPTTEQHALGRSGVQLTLHLVGHSVLEAHRLWNGSRVLADYLEEREAAADESAGEAAGKAAGGGSGAPGDESRPIRGKTVLELGAGAALPGIVCGLVLGARRVVVTDYPDPDLVATMQKNIGECDQSHRMPPGTVVADGYVWGADPTPLLAHLADLAAATASSPSTTPPLTNCFDVVLLADLLFRHTEHAHLAASVAQTLRYSPASRAYVFFTSYRPWLRHKDLAFFEHARDAGLVVEHLLEKRLEQPPLFFADDPGDVGVRSTVSGYSLRWPRPGPHGILENPAAFWPPPGGVDSFDEASAA